ncbi:eCIS core domain-containing protein [Shinella sp.]|uniref:eCIS core domain-containing protein n=1 Tax=Shinella sp. TaxID=1870904 RepID=UPI0040369BE9
MIEIVVDSKTTDHQIKNQFENQRSLTSSSGPVAIYSTDREAAGRAGGCLKAYGHLGMSSYYAGAPDSETTERAKKHSLHSATPTNNTGLPDNLKSGVESLSGMSLDNVRVHYNSSKPAQLNAHAYAQGSEIHLAPGQERHVPHEAWHVVQQRQGRVKPTLPM